ncbi:MAG TPA: hypothetical protein VHC69_28530 [Polyangiaceae bacterium]|nr:hypothetical protein [Polyangiaceae bacterium]
MPGEQVFPLAAIRTDGWFERIGESVGSFQALCDIIGERFFAFSMITGARITALTVDRRNPDNTLVDFVVGMADEDSTRADTQRLTLAEFRRRLVSALVADEPAGPPPKRLTDTEAVQLHVGVRYLLLAPLYGYSLLELLVGGTGSTLRVLHDGVEETHALPAFRERIKTHVRQEVTRIAKAGGRSAIDLSHVKAAEEAADAGDHQKVVQLLGQWPGPLTIFLRTPEGQMLNAETRALIARGLGLLGTACVAIGDCPQGEEILRLAVQYAGDGTGASEIYSRLGEALLEDDRAGEAIGPLRRAANLGAPGDKIWPLLARAFDARGRSIAAYGAVLEARAAGVDDAVIRDVIVSVESKLGDVLTAWRKHVGEGGPAQIS